MSRPEKAPEPSMEEILASIRKIIAEEPIGSRPAPMPMPPAPEAGATSSSQFHADDRIEPAALPFPGRGGSEAPSYSVEDAFADLIEDAPSKIDQPSPTARSEAPRNEAGVQSSGSAPTNAEDDRPAWLFNRTNAVPAPQGGGAAPLPLTGGTALSALEILRQNARPDLAGPDSPKPDQPAAARPVAETRPADPRLPTPSATPSQGEIESPRPAPSRAALPDLDVSRVLGAGREPGSADTARAEAPRTVEAPKPAAPAAVEPAQRKPISALDTLAQGLAGGSGLAAAKPEPVLKVEPKVEIKPEPKRDPAPVAKAEPVAPVAKPAPAAEPAPAPATSAGVSPQMARTLEDTVADLLRPMLRDWLDTNMPRIVEKALRVELAANAKRDGSKTQG